ENTTNVSSCPQTLKNACFHPLSTALSLCPSENCLSLRKWGKNVTDSFFFFFTPSLLSMENKQNSASFMMMMLTVSFSPFFCFSTQKRAKGQFLFFKVCEHLNLMEKDYFGLTYKDTHDHKCWLDPTKEIKRQIRNSWQFSFNVKFYPPDPSLLTEDLTRYLLCLQLREDVACGRLPCSFVTHTLLGSYTLQAELGDYEVDQPKPLDYMSQLTFAPNQNKDMEEKILELHKSHRGMTPAQADAQFLENAKKLSMYGVDLHHAKDSEGVDITLGVCANGLLVYKDRLRINRFAWPKILKISYKRNNFYIKIRPGETEQFESTVGFKLQNHRSAKRLWKVCVENHSFFRLNAPEPPTKARFLTLGSKFRYSGRTQAQTRVASSLIDRPAPNFERTSSKRISRSLDGGNELYISQLKRSFMEAPPPSPPQPNQWEKRLTSSPTTTIRVQPSLFDPLFSAVSPVLVVPNDHFFCFCFCPPCVCCVRAHFIVELHVCVCVLYGCIQTAEVEIEETVVVQEVSKAPKPTVVTIEKVPHEPVVKVEEAMPVAEEDEPNKRESVSSESESEEEAEYHPNVHVSIAHSEIPEEKEEEEEEEEEVEVHVVEQIPNDTILPPVIEEAAPVEVQQQETHDAERPKEAEEKHTTEPENDESTDDPMLTPEEAPPPNGLPLAEEDSPDAGQEEPKVNGQPMTVETEHRPQVICCTEPPVVKTEMVTISDTFAAQKTEIATKEVPIVHTETKTITYEASQLDGNADGEPGVLMTAQTITSESLCTTTTTHITKTLKGGLSETRIEKRIVITGDCDIDHDEALAQAIKEAKEQHPDMSVTRVVVHKETELAEEEED
uniref:Erythrocyte membrane protein band 4.1 like 2 n=1 Tax=Neogobius melanostomus TaxID=47308 RepID=A0A8C6TKZ6_9GOBI